MDHVADKDRGRIARAGVDHDISRCVAGGGLEPQPVLKGIIVVDQLRLSGPYYRQYAVLKGAAVRRVFAAFMHLLPMGELAAGHDIARIRESRDPAPVVEPGVPADMVPVQ